jgi:6-pyruvoyltetrahydropterin/6-carboxytetrahydropterin synthase
LTDFGSGIVRCVIVETFDGPATIRPLQACARLRAMPARYRVRVEARFESAHFLRSYHGVAEPLHGHSYKVEAELSLKEGSVDHESIAVDFVAAKKMLETIAKQLDYKCINDVPPFTEKSPSAENIAEWFHQQLAPEVARDGALVDRIVLWEGPVNSVIYEPDTR